ncbi:MAG: PEP-utilizing enzyme [Acidimicrobiia bacterium]|nr:PEP-utilizing enzyme [Acidimicrobiia bacterium]MDH4308912.1 PEP-utilizing enzyme [Acidimicrobiia bacterium]MDH5293533.1 PEP-utilizing enzyme [Acidimicrobiia bacterium]
MILTLDDVEATDPAVAGAKAAWLARGRQASLPVLPGIVVPADASKEPMAFGVEVMGLRGSGGARLAMSQQPLSIPLSEALLDATESMPEPMIVRSSSILEGQGEWSGAFTSYLEIFHGEVETAVRGCWASAFTVHTLERYEAAKLAPGSAPMAVLVQPALSPEFGGTARIAGDDVIVVGVAGSPAPLVQGWEPGSHARVGTSGVISGAEAIELMSTDLIGSVAELLRQAHDRVGATGCEWASAGGELVLFQLLKSSEPAEQGYELPTGLVGETASRVARAVRRAPGPLGESLVLPWALGNIDVLVDDAEPIDIDPVEALRTATEHSRALTAEVWDQAKPMAAADAQEVLRLLRSSDPSDSLARLEMLRPPDPDRAALVLGLLAQVRRALVALGAVTRPELGWHMEPEKVAAVLAEGRADRLRDRIGFDRWEPFDAALIMTQGRWAEGTSAAPGVAAGRLCFISDPYDTSHFRPRDVVVGTHPIPNLAALLWDAAALITTGGGPAAHLFESARALAIPAVCAIHLDEALASTLAEANGQVAVAVDGTNGKVAVTPW